MPRTDGTAQPGPQPRTGGTARPALQPWMRIDDTARQALHRGLGAQHGRYFIKDRRHSTAGTSSRIGDTARQAGTRHMSTDGLGGKLI